MPASVVIFAVLLLSTVSSCSRTVPAKSGDAATTIDVGPTIEAGQTIDFGQVQQDAASGTAVAPDNVMFPAAPDLACGGDAGECPLPPSACADPSCDGGGICPGWQWVVYYDDPVCVSGKCVYTNWYFKCDALSMCSLGGCHYNGTAALDHRAPSVGGAGKLGTDWRRHDHPQTAHLVGGLGAG
jgi:hypothetical protein